MFTAYHKSVLRALSPANDELNLFIPVSTAKQFRSVLRTVPFLCDRAVFTQLPTSESQSLESHLVQIIPLWHFGGVQFGSLLHKDIAKVIREYDFLFIDGGVSFYPSPTMVHVPPDSSDRLLSPWADRSPSVPIWQESRLFQQYISADKINANHMVLSNYKTLAAIGREVGKIEIPYLANLNSEMLHNVLKDNRQSLVAFRRRTRTLIEDLVGSGSDLEDVRIRRRFARDLEDGVRELEGKVRSLKKTAAIKNAGVVLVTAVATLNAVSAIDISAVASKLIGSGGLSAVAFEYINYLLQLRDQRRSPFHIVWQLKQGQIRK